MISKVHHHDHPDMRIRQRTCISSEAHRHHRWRHCNQHHDEIDDHPEHEDEADDDRCEEDDEEENSHVMTNVAVKAHLDDDFHDDDNDDAHINDDNHDETVPNVV